MLRYNPTRRMDTQAILITFLVACVVTVLAFFAHGRLAGTTERPGCLSMLMFVLGWLALLLAIITGVFLFSNRGG